MRLADDAETWIHATTVRGRTPRPCDFCGEAIAPGTPRAQRGTLFAHYACAPGLGSPVYRTADWLAPVFGASTRLGGREENEDRFRVVASPSGSVVRLAVADGMGGYAAGAEAAAAAVSALDVRAPLFEVVQEAHRRACAASSGGTTLTIVEVRRTASVLGGGEGREVVLAQVGDSTGAVYGPERGKEGPTLNRLIQTTPQGKGNRLYQCLGTRNGGPCDPMMTRAKVGRGALCLLYSDGVNPAMDPFLLLPIARRFTDPLTLSVDVNALASALTEEAGRLGSTDNATLLAFRIP